MIRKIRKGEITENILSAIKEGISGTGDFITAFLEAGYGASINRLEYVQSRNRRNREVIVSAHGAQQRERQRYFTLLYKLRRDGLITDDTKLKTKTFTLTAKGKEKLRSLRERLKGQLPPPMYAPTQQLGAVIVSFDVPERERKKRVWLRSALCNLDFQKVQQSVWLGRKKLPSDFIDDLQRFGMLDYVEIFEISKAGTLKHVA